MRAGRLQLLDDGQEVTDGTGEAVEADHDQGVAGPDVAQQMRQDGPVAVGARSVFLGSPHDLPKTAR